MRAALAVLLLALGLAAGDASAALQEPRQAWALATTAPGPAEPPPPGADWKQVTLPDDAAISRPAQYRMATWYRIAFDYPGDAGRQEQWAAYLPYFYDGGALWLNGSLLASVAEDTDEVHARSYRPQMVAFPAPSLHPGRNELMVRTARSSIYPLRFPRVSIGPQAELARWDPLESTCRHASLSIL